ncbi:hypothetical protein [Arenimonas sp. MALMAid1274]|uniref:hypothetical protein n=1 Tax=Arenimonas sp. MALMAid1274 TaxID=3411630 RepID=UPI003B9EC548
MNADENKQRVEQAGETQALAAGRKQRKARKPSAGRRDLSAAVAQVHQPRGTPNPEGVCEVDVRDLKVWLLLAAGDAPKRKTFFDHDDSQRAGMKHGKPVFLVLGPKAALHDYRTKKGQRSQRSMITIPPKLRESIQACFGADSPRDFPLTTAIIALADYAAFVLKRDNKCLQVDAAEDRFAEKRKAARKLIRQANSKRS